MTDSVAETVLLPVSEAALRLGLSPIAVRSRVRRGSIPHRRGNGGNILVELPANAAPPAGKLAGTTADASAGASVAAELEAEIDALRHELAFAKGAAAATEAIAAAQVAAAERIVAELRAMLDASRAELAELRRPWWRKWIT